MIAPEPAHHFGQNSSTLLLAVQTNAEQIAEVMYRVLLRELDYAEDYDISELEMKLESDGMAFSEEIKIEALRSPRIRFGEISIMYSSRLGEAKLNPWRDGFHSVAPAGRGLL